MLFRSRSHLGDQVAEQRKRVADRLASIGQVVAVMSGKGGVGKSYVSSLIAVAASAEGRAALALEGIALEGIDVGRFRARVGEDASCLNLYQPRVPTVIAASPSFIEERRFSFAASLAESPEEHDNPWRLLEREVDSEGAIPVIVDASALTYVLHQSLGDVMSLGETGVRVRFVGTLAPGLLQGELITGERHFLQAVPGEAGYRFFPSAVDAERAPALSQALRQCAKLRARFLSWFVDGTFIGDCILTEPCPEAVVAAYVLPDKALILVLNTAVETRPVTIACDLAPWLPPAVGGYRVQRYDGEGTPAASSTLPSGKERMTVGPLEHLGIALLEASPK